ncbi:hypothetical protein TcCL_NonESM09433 [Trypanosoma cruzi]|nr:hypothetical protein TcCL_NonESM09433 [Trypanosoma cruzi]
MRKPIRCPIPIIKRRVTLGKDNHQSTNTHKSERSKLIPPPTCTSPTLRFQMRSSRNKNKGHPRQPRNHLILPRRCGRSSTGGAAHHDKEEEQHRGIKHTPGHVGPLPLTLSSFPPPSTGSGHAATVVCAECLHSKT